MDRINAQFFDCICRTCMNKILVEQLERQWQSIFDTNEECGTLPISELLSSIIPKIDIKKSDELPKKICRECLLQVKGMYRFQQMCLHSDEQMRGSISTKSITDAKCEINIQQKVDCVNTLPGSPSTNYPLQSNCVKNETCDYNISDNENSDQEAIPSTINVKTEIIPISIEAARHKKLDEERDPLPANKFCFECEFCDRSFQNPESLHEHRLTHKSKSRRNYACKLCENSYKSRNALSRHRKFEHDGGKIQDIKKKYTCQVCNKDYANASVLKVHLRTHTDERPFLCPECGKAFSTAGSLKQHSLRHSDIKAFECPYCPLKFRCKNDVTVHKKIHSGQKPNKCDICGAGFYKPYDLKRHKSNHSGERPHKCEYCDMRFGRKTHQRTHMLTHTGERPHKCKYCKRSFTHSGDHIKHLRTHLGDNVYRCSLCPASFRLVSELRLHFATHKYDDEETRQRNLKALKEEEAMIELKLTGKEIQNPKSNSQ